VFVSVTRLRVRRLRYLPGFLLWSWRSAAQARQAAGNRGVRLLRDANRAFWTCSGWNDESAMRAFLLATPHRIAMGKLAEWCDEAAMVHWSQESADLPDWTEGHRRLLAEGRRSRVRHPSDAHQSFQIAVPRTG
jgi:hypothetical protein